MRWRDAVTAIVAISGRSRIWDFVPPPFNILQILARLKKDKEKMERGRERGRKRSKKGDKESIAYTTACHPAILQ